MIDLPEGWWLVLIGSCFGLLMVVGIAFGREERSIPRAIGKAKRGDIDGAVAAVLARINERRPDSTAPSSLNANPYAPPTSVVVPVEDQTLARDLNLLGTFEGMRPDWTKARDWFRQSYQAGLGQPRFVANQGVALVNLGQPAEGLILIQRAIAKLPEGDIINRIQYLTQAARAAIDLGQAAEAIDLLDRAEAQRGLIFPKILKQSLGEQINRQRARVGALADLDARGDHG